MFHVLIDGKYHPSDNLPPSSINKATIDRRERRKRSKVKDEYCNLINCQGCDLEQSPNKDLLVKAMKFATKYSLAPLPKAVPCVKAGYVGTPFSRKSFYDVIQEEGKTPMRYNDNYASASVQTVTAPSETSVQRDYLLGRLANADYPKLAELGSFFNMYTDNTPKTYKELIDAIKNDKFSIDKKVQKRMEVAEENDDEDDYFFGGPFTGIIWAGPQADRDGYFKAVQEKTKQYTAAKDIIMTGDATAGLKALQDFEAWLPTPAVTTTIQ